MRHRKNTLKLSRTQGHRRALLRNLCRSLFISESITATKPKAKAAQKLAERLITLAKTDTLHHRRLVYKVLCDHKLVKRLFAQIAPRFKDVEGGYTRVFNLGFRKGDGAQLAILELTKKQIREKVKKQKKEEKSKETKKTIESAKSQEIKKQSKPALRDFIRKVFRRERDSL